MDAYEKGLNGREAAWAASKYRGHRIIPETLMADMEKAKMRWNMPDCLSFISSGLQNGQVLLYIP